MAWSVDSHFRSTLVQFHLQHRSALRNKEKKQSSPKRFGRAGGHQKPAELEEEGLGTKMRNRFNFHPIFCWTCRKSCTHHHNEKKCDDGQLCELLLALSLRLLRVDRIKFYMFSISPTFSLRNATFCFRFYLQFDDFFLFLSWQPRASNVNVL